ncbi:MAG: 50S ribosomal protein L30e [Candidatus Thalassarchaeaceae archaeon]
MDISRQIKQGISTGKLVFGQRETLAACARGDARLVLIAANCPEEHVVKMSSSHPNIPVHRLNMVNRELGSACAKPFSISSVCVIDAGQSDLMTLDHNL